MPASVAYATPCGSTITAPTSPASASARSVVRSTRGHQARNGKSERATGGIRVSMPSRRLESGGAGLDLPLPGDDEVLDVAHQQVEQVRDDTDHDDPHDDDVRAQEVGRVQHHLAEAYRGGDHFRRDES